MEIHQQEFEKKGRASPLSLPQAGKSEDTPPPTSLSVFPHQQVDPRLRALSRAGSPDERRRLGGRFPELRSPHRCLTDRENLVLEWSYWDGLSDANIEQKLGGAFLPHVVCNEALRKLAKHVSAKRKPVQGAPRQIPEVAYNAPHKHDGIAEFQLASTAKQRRAAATKHPELRPPHDALDLRENALLELAYWQGLTYKEIGEMYTFSSGRASQVCNKALRKLSYRLARGGHLGVAADLDLDSDPRLDDFRTARSVSMRRTVAARYPELRPPHTFLQDRENDVLERFYWKGQTFDSIAEPYRLTRNEVTKLRDEGLRKLNFHYRRTRAQAAKSSAEELKAAQSDVPVQATPSVLGEDARITALRRLGHPDNRREVAGRYPELRPPHECLSQTENDLLELALWQGRPYAEIASRKGLTRREVGTGVRGALERLNRHLCCDTNDDEDHLDTVLLALNEYGSARRAAKKLRVSKDVLRAFIERAGIKSRIVFEVEA